MSSSEFSLWQEILTEMGNDILGTLSQYDRRNNIAPEDPNDPINIMRGLVWDIKQEILSAETGSELEQIEMQLKFVQLFSARIEDQLSCAVTAGDPPTFQAARPVPPGPLR